METGPPGLQLCIVKHLKFTTMNKTVFITGTSTGFGKLTAITLANAGLTVIAGMRNTGDKNRAVAEELGAIPNIEVMEIDLTDDVSVSKAFEQVLAKHGKNRCPRQQLNALGQGLFGKMAAYMN